MSQTSAQSTDILLLRYLSDSLRAEISRRLRRIKVTKGRTLVERGSRTTDILFLTDGRAEVVMYSSNGREVCVNIVGPGDIIGEIAALDGEPRSASVVAASDLSAVVMRADDFLFCVQSSPDAAIWLARRLTSSIRRLTEQVFELSALNVQTRIHCELLRLAHKGKRQGNVIEVQPAPTHAQLANRIGTQREAVTREMQALSDMGIIQYRRGSLTIVDLPRLEQLTYR